MTAVREAPADDVQRRAALRRMKALAGGLLVLAAVAGLYLRRMGDSNSRGVAPNPLSKRAP